VARPKKAPGEASIAFGVTLTPEAKKRLERMMAEDDETNRSRWLTELVDEEWERRQRRARFRVTLGDPSQAWNPASLTVSDSLRPPA
jgi:hypothetical protein